MLSGNSTRRFYGTTKMDEIDKLRKYWKQLDKDFWSLSDRGLDEWGRVKDILEVFDPNFKYRKHTFICELKDMNLGTKKI